jgi:hypothetical protein
MSVHPNDDEIEVAILTTTSPTASFPFGNEAVDPTNIFATSPPEAQVKTRTAALGVACLPSNSSVRGLGDPRREDRQPVQ